MSALTRRAWVLILGGLVGGGFYFLLIDTTSLPELYVLAGVAVACAVATLLAREQRFVEASVVPWWLLRGWRLVAKIPSDIAFLCWEALAQTVRPRSTRGEFRAAPFGAIEQTPSGTGRRAVAETVGSIAPNTIVVGVDSDRGLVVVHQLRRRGGPEDLDVTRLG